MPEEPVKLDETLDAKPYEPPKRDRRLLRFCAVLGIGVLMVGLAVCLHTGRKCLAENLSIETLGDTATPLLTTGTALPASRTESFSTVHDSQAFIDIHLVHGCAVRASENQTVGKYQIAGIPPLPRGQPEISVTFLVAPDGQVQVTANMQGTPHPIKLVGPLTERVAVR